MSFKFFFLFAFLSSAIAGEIFGTFQKGPQFKTAQGQILPVTTATADLAVSVETLAERGAMVSLPETSLSSTGVFVSEAPMVNKGTLGKNGILRLNEQGQFELSGELVEFAPGKILNKHKFDEISKKHFLNKRVQTRGNHQNGVYVIASIVEEELFSAKLSPELVGSAEAVKLHAPFKAMPESYILKTLPTFKLSSGATSFRGTVFGNHEGVAGEEVMLMILSGSQGDSRSAVNGHIAVGLGKVQPDYSIDGEIYNVYIPPYNQKEIVSGSQRLADYFGHVVSGQNNYRPSFTLILYGVDPEKLRRIRESLERYHAHFRVTDKQMSVAVNCDVFTVLAMAREGIYGTIRNGKNGTTKFPLLSEEFKKPVKQGIGKQLKYLFKTPMEEFLPRPTWDSFLKNISYLNEHEDLGAHRVDFVFYGQTPSSRPRGGAAADGLGDDLRVFMFGKPGLRRVR